MHAPTHHGSALPGASSAESSRRRLVTGINPYALLRRLVSTATLVSGVMCAVPVMAQDPGLDPSHGTAFLSHDDDGIVQVVDVEGGGIVDVSRGLGVGIEACTGRTSHNPDLIVGIDDRRMSLVLTVVSEADLGLLVVDGTGAVTCVTGTNASPAAMTLRIEDPSSIAVFVTSAERGTHAAQLGVMASRQQLGAPPSSFLNEVYSEVDSSLSTPAGCSETCREAMEACEGAIIDLEVACQLRRRGERARVVGGAINTAAATAGGSVEGAVIGGAEIAGDIAGARAGALNCDADVAELGSICAFQHSQCIASCP